MPFFLVNALNYRWCLPPLLPRGVRREGGSLHSEGDKERGMMMRREDRRNESNEINMDGRRERKPAHRWRAKGNVINNHSGKCFTAKRMCSCLTLCVCVCALFICISEDLFAAVHTVLHICAYRIINTWHSASLQLANRTQVVLWMERN